MSPIKTFIHHKNMSFPMLYPHKKRAVKMKNHSQLLKIIHNSFLIIHLQVLKYDVF